jgi:hypothetical protein
MEVSLGNEQKGVRAETIVMVLHPMTMMKGALAASRLSRLFGVLAAALVLFTSTPGANACSLCGCGDPLLATNDPAAITGLFLLQLDTEYLRVDAGTDGSPGYTDKLTQWSFRLNAVYRPISRLALIATLPVLDKTIHTVGGGADITNSHLTGIGDAELGARYALWRSINMGVGRVQEIAIAGGIMMPTGANDAKGTDKDTVAGTLVDPHGQLGTGAWGPFLGLHYRFEQVNWLGFADFSYRMRTTGSYFDGIKYKFGDAALWSVHGQYRPVATLAADLGVDGRFARVDKITDASEASSNTQGNTGGLLLSAAPGVYFNAVGTFWVFARAQIPFYKNLFGEQDVKPSVALGLQYQVL